MIAALLTVALAEEPCTKGLTAEELYAMDARSNLAVQNDDAAGHEAVMDELAERVACLDGPIPQGPWARILVNETIVRFARKEPWDHVLATALAVDAGVGNVPEFVRDAYVAPTRLEGAAVPSGVRLLVDGRPAERVPAAQGLHVVQREFEDGWRSVLLRDAAVPDALLVPPPRKGIPGWSTVGLSGAASRWSQGVPDSGDFLGEDDATQTRIALASHGRIPLALQRRLGLTWDVTAGTQLFSSDGLTVRPAGSAFAGASVGETVAVSLGGGAVVMRSHTDSADAVHVAPLPWLAAQTQPGALDFAGGAGWTPAAWQVSGRAGWSLEGALALRFGLHVDASHMGLQLVPFDPAEPVRDLALTELAAGLTVGLRLAEP